MKKIKLVETRTCMSRFRKSGLKLGNFKFCTIRLYLRALA